MLRLIAIAVASFASFFVYLIIASRVTGESDFAGGAAVILGFIATPIILLRVWPGLNSSSKCPGGKGLYPECLFLVKIGEEEFSVQRPDGIVQSLPIAELDEVAIVTNDSGPGGADVWWVLAGKTSQSGCTFPGGATGEHDILHFVQKLPGFNNERFIQAMGSTSNAKFTCWSAAGA